MFRPVERVRARAAIDLAGYYGMVENIDFNVGRIMRELVNLGIDRETYIVFFSDHVDIAPTTLGLCGIEVPEAMTGFVSQEQSCSTSRVLR